jgi:hypothetical protein
MSNNPSIAREWRDVRMPELVWAYDTTMQGANLVVIQEYGSRVEADLAKCTLEDAGIEAMSQADTAGGMREHLAWPGAGFQILVREEDAAAASGLLTKPAKGGERSDSDFETDDDSESPWWRFT